MTRCVMITTDAVGGVWTYATGLARGLCARGNEVTLVTMGPAPRSQQLEPLRDLRGLSVQVTDLALEWMDPDGADTRAHDVLLSIADRARPDVVHLNGYREGALPWPAPSLVVAHSCVWSWWEACRGTQPHEARWHRYAAAAAAGLRAADAWAAPTESFRRSVEEHYRPPGPGRVVRNGVELPLSVSPKEPLILAAGRLWDEAKNLAALDRIAAQLDWPVYAAGPTESRGTDRHAEHSVAYLGVLSHQDMIRHMQRASIFVSPALYEPFGLSVLEAAACGCALVLSDITTFRELWLGAALLVDPEDAEALADALERLCADDALRARMQQAARKRARRYRFDTMVNAYERLYASVLERSASSQTTSAAAAPTECRA